MQDVGSRQDGVKKFHHCSLKENPAIRLIRIISTCRRINIYPWTIEETIVPEEKHFNRRIWDFAAKCVVRNAFEADRNSSMPGGGRRLETELLEIDYPVSWNDNCYSDPELLQRQRQSADDVGQSSNLSERYALRRDHNDF